MATTEFDVTAAEVLETISGTDASAADPGTTIIAKWVTRFAADVNLALRGIGVDPSTITSVNDDELYEAVRSKIIMRCAAEWHIQNQREITEYDRTQIDEFRDFVVALRRQPGHVTGETGHNNVPRTYPEGTTSLDLATRQPRSWIDKSRGFG